MNKAAKIALILFGVLTVLTLTASAVMLFAVNGDGLLTLNSDLGAIYAHSYRWVTLAAGVMIFAWAILLYSKRNRRFARPKRDYPTDPAVSDAPVEPETASGSEEKGGWNAL